MYIVYAPKTPHTCPRALCAHTSNINNTYRDGTDGGTQTNAALVEKTGALVPHTCVDMVQKQQHRTYGQSG